MGGKNHIQCIVHRLPLIKPTKFSKKLQCVRRNIYIAVRKIVIYYCESGDLALMTIMLKLSLMLLDMTKIRKKNDPKEPQREEGDKENNDFGG